MRSFRASSAVLLVASVLLALAAPAAPGVAQKAGATPPDTAPSVSLYLDSAAAVRALAALPAPELPDSIPPLFSLDFDTTGAVDTVYGVFHQLPAAFTDTVVSILRAHARRQAPFPDPSGFYFRVAAGPGASIAVTNVEMWSPELSNRSEVGRLLSRVSAQHREAVGQGATVRLKFRVLAQGTVEQGSVQVLTSTGDDALDRDMVAVAHQIRFRSARVERIPVHVSVVLPMTVQPLEELREYRVVAARDASWGDSLSDLVDAAALERALAALPPLDGRRTALFRVRLDTRGAAKAVEPVFDHLDPARAQALAEAIRPHLKPRPSPEPRQFYLRVTPGPRARVEHRRDWGDSPPALAADSRETLGALREAVQRHGRGWGRIQLLFAVRADGTIDLASLEFIGPTPTRPLALALREIVGRMRFRPAVVDDVPARAWVRIPLWIE